ncbi:MAG TPA: 3-deoxy-D-manno-octulosonic acid transferase [Caldimonas sp.]|nr:3-deoxy-D-manno-octulosonic acid transferase [Caldimonas sp.]HEX4235499.1 3-deoxy-D-manno-octulosonic acid transferase [Caldimonas sp.]
MSATVRQRLARAGYSLLVRGIVPLFWLKLRWRGRREALYASAIGERFGFYRDAIVPGAVWLHAVSLGETRAAAPLMDALRRLRPGIRLVLTHGTATGRAAGQALLGEGDRQLWLPFDTPGAVRRFVRRVAPAVGVLMETEIWPNLLAAAARDGVPVVLANARLSERSRHRGARVDALLRPAFASLASALAQSDADALRLRAAGVGEVRIVGNLKYDVAPDLELLERGRGWRTRVAGGVVLAASTREGEEAELLAAWRATPAPRPLLVVVPRHPQRFDAVAEMIAAAGLTLSRRSAWVAGQPPVDADRVDVWLGDSMLEMPAWYAFADVALLGGSFAPLGGQNLIEAAACGCPLVLGPHTFNFSDAAELAIAAGAATRVADLGTGVAAAIALASAAGAPARGQQSEAARAFASAHRGAAERMARRILEVADSHRRA